VKPDNENPPDMSAAPGSETPLKRAMPGDHIFLLGLGNDELGYLVPPYDFVLAGSASAYFNEAPGDHYEETNSIGPETLPMVRAHLEELAGSLGD